MQFLKLVDAVNQCLHALYVHSVVAACTEAAYQTVTLDADHTLGGSELEELVEQVFIARLQHEADIHAAAVFLILDGCGKELAVVDAVVEQVCLLLVAFVYPLHAAALFEPAHVEQSRVDGQYGRCIEH